MAVKLTDKEKWKNAFRLSQWRLVLDKPNKRAMILVPSISVGFYNRRGLVSVPQLQRMFSEARLLAYFNVPEGGETGFVEYDKLQADRFTFMASTSSTYSRNLLMTSTVPSLTIYLELGYIGKSSLNTRAQLVDRNTGRVFAENINQVVSVDKESRTPLPLPDWWVEKYRSWQSADGSKLIVPLMDTHSTAHRYRVRVTWSNTDYYGHTNYVAYLRFCYDAVMDAMQHGLLTNFQGDIDDYETKKTTMNYQHECRAGDDIDVSLWPEDDPYIVHFSIHKGDTLLFQCTLEFHEPEDTRL